MRALSWAVAWLGLLGCEAQRVEQAEAAPPAKQVTELRGASDRARQKRPFGRACQDADDCESGVCLHVEQSSRLEGRRCSASCSAHTECEEGSCAQVFPSDDGWFCLPEVRR